MKQTLILCEIDLDIIMCLLQGQDAILTGNDSREPNVHITLKKQDIPDGLQDALDKIEMWWRE